VRARRGPYAAMSVGAGEVDVGALVAAAQRGDRAALDRLLHHQHDRLWAVCRRIVGNDADAADATQEALIAVVRGLPRFDGRAAFGTWCYRIAVNAALDELRRRKRRPLLGGPDATAAIGDGGEPDPGPAFDTRVVDRDRLDAALARLPEEFRVPVVLRDVCDLDYAEIAETLQIPPGTVRSRIARGRAALATWLRNQEPASDRPSDRP
jgi:RNA polymerase sigma-70 factor, ECF subfamily